MDVSTAAKILLDVCGEYKMNEKFPIVTDPIT